MADMAESVDDFELSDLEDDDVSIFGSPSPALPVVKNWRGLAHYRTWSRRRVFQKNKDKRTSSELYLLEETIAELEPIASLPHSIRLEICRCLGYQKLEPNSILAVQGDVGSTLFIVFTGSVKATKHIPGQQEDDVTLYAPGHWFGETVFEKDKVIWDSTFSTAERCEILTLTKKEYENIIKIPGTAELKARLQFLKEITALKDVSKQSLKRLANVLTGRTFHKNRVITFQGDDASEMFFIRTGECRVVMEIHSRHSTPSLPRASSAQSQYWPNCHRKCKQEIHDREKDWWRPSLVSRPSTRGSRIASRCHSQPTQPVLPEALPKEMMYRMLTHKKTTNSPAQPIEPLKKDSTGTNGKVSGAKRPYTAPSPKPGASAMKKKASIIGSEEGDPLSPWRASPDVMGQTRSTTRASNRSSAQGFHACFADSTPEPAAASTQDSKSRLSGTSARFKSPSAMQDLHRKRRLGGNRKRISSSVRKNKYTFSTFVKDCEEKDKSRNKQDVEFSEKENKLWQMGLTTAGTMPAVFMTNENRYYQKKFTKWARNVMERERKLLSYDVLEGTPTLSFMPGLPGSGVVKLERSSSPAPKRATPDNAAASKSTPSNSGSSQSTVSSILDIGALIDGQYFGERGLLMESKRAASVVAVSLVDTLVLNKWDFHRHCDRDVIRALALHEYKREEEIYNLYVKTRKWEVFKKQVVEDICSAKSARRSSRVVRPVRVVTRPDGRTIEIPLKNWAY